MGIFDHPAGTRIDRAMVGAAIAAAAEGALALDVIVSCAFGSPFGDVADPALTSLFAELYEQELAEAAP